MAEEWYPEPARPGLLTRLLASGGTRPAPWALFAAAAGLAAFVASLLLDWVTVRIDPEQVGVLVSQIDSPSRTDMQIDIGIVGAQQLGTAYLIGVLGLLVMLGVILTDATGARRLRLGASGLGIAIAGVLAATVRDLAETAGGIASSSSVMLGLDARYADAISAAAEVSLGPGTFCGAAAVVLLVAGVLTARTGAAVRPAPSGVSVLDGVPTQGGAQPPDGPTVRVLADQPATVPGAAATVHGPAARSSRPVGQVGELSVSSAEAIDLGTDSDVLGPGHRGRGER